MNKPVFLSSWLVAVTMLFTSLAWAEEIKLPHRERFKDIETINIQDLYSQRDQVILVDVRSPYEFETLHIKGAVNIPLGSKNFAKNLAAIRKQTVKRIVMYCNGGTCKKSYKAVRAAKKAEVLDCVAYDAGIYNWAKRYPEHSVLLGKSPMRANEFIENKKFKQRLLTAEQFESHMGKNALVLDIRDRIQRDTMVFPFEEKRAELAEMNRIKNVVVQAKKSNKTLLIYDKVGKQVRWFQYFLEKEGVTNYYFMKGGSESYYEQKLGKFRIKNPDRS